MTRKRIGALLSAVTLAALCAACGAPQPDVKPLQAPAEDPEWQVVSTKPEDFQIVYDDKYWPDMVDYPLDKLVAYCLGSDGIYAEEGFDWLYQRFLEAPNTCVTYFSLIQDADERDVLCSHIAYADVGWYEVSEEFKDALSQLEQSEHSADVTEVVARIRASYEESLDAYLYSNQG